MKVSKVSRYPNIKHSTNNNPHIKRREDLMSANYHPIPVIPTQMELQLEVVMAETAQTPQLEWPPKESGDVKTVAETLLRNVLLLNQEMPEISRWKLAADKCRKLIKHKDNAEINLLHLQTAIS